MMEFLQSYGVWIFFGLFFLLMMRGHGHGGMGCGMGGHRGDHEAAHEVKAGQNSDGESQPPGRCH